MEDYNVQDNALTNNVITLLERTLVNHQRLKIERITDITFCRSIDAMSSDVNNVMLLVKENPRFDWVVIQNEIDECFSKDKNATGVSIQLDWREVEKGSENRILIKGKIGKAS
jgi:hypothetical protein